MVSEREIAIVPIVVELVLCYILPFLGTLRTSLLKHSLDCNNFLSVEWYLVCFCYFFGINYFNISKEINYYILCKYISYLKINLFSVYYIKY